MASPKYRLQAVRGADAHSLALNELFNLDDIDRAYIGVAFARQAGVRLVAEALGNLGSTVRVFVGIRNDITSAQALIALLNLDVELYVVDTGRATEIFHPKLYAAISDETAVVIVGSPNLTAGGLEGNIEGSTALELNLDEEEDREYVEDLEEVFKTLVDDYPDNVIRITSARQIARLLKEGRVADETIRRLPASTSTSSAGGAAGREVVPRMQLARRNRVPRPRPTPNARGPRTRTGFTLVWESDDLSERDLNIPKNPGTNPTGSMTLRKGRTLGIDHRHYFRDELFRSLPWVPDPAPARAHLETAAAPFDVVIKGVSYGRHLLEIRHDTRTNSASYHQNNAMTHLRWGAVRPLVARRDLLGSTLRIYRRGTGANQTFALEII